MLIVAAEVRVTDGAIDQARDALRTMEQETRREAGCLTYVFSVDLSDPTTLRIFERWESMAALSAHFKTPHMADFSQAVARIRPTSMSVKVYEVARELPLPT
jgi:quinol monooxygenase YgiN